MGILSFLDKKKIVRLKKNSEMSVEAENAEAQFRLGLSYLNSDEQQDYQKAVEYFERASLQGHKEAQFNLGLLYINGFGVHKDYEIAKKYFEMASSGGYALAEFALGLLYMNGIGVDKDYEIAKKFFGQSCDHGYQKGCDMRNIIHGQFTMFID